MPTGVITNLLRGAAAFCLAVTPLILPSPTAAAAATIATTAVVPVPEVLPLENAVGRLPVAEEDRTGCTRTSFRHWNTGLGAGAGQAKGAVTQGSRAVGPLLGAPGGSDGTEDVRMG